jgi:hypothetical protein
VVSQATFGRQAKTTTALRQQLLGGGGAASITFSSIPATYKHLQIRISARCAIATVFSNIIAYRVNSDTGANYTIHYMFGDGASVTTAGAFTS